MSNEHDLQTLRDQIDPRRTFDPDQVKRKYNPEAIESAGHLLQDLLDQSSIRPEEHASLAIALREATRGISTKGLGRRKFFGTLKSLTTLGIGLTIAGSGGVFAYDYILGDTAKQREINKQLAAEAAERERDLADRQKRAALEASNALGIVRSVATPSGWTIRHGLLTERFAPIDSHTRVLTVDQQIKFSASRLDALESTNVFVGKSHKRSYDDVSVPTLNIASKVDPEDTNGRSNYTVAENWIIMMQPSEVANSSVIVFEKGSDPRAFSLIPTRNEGNPGFTLRGMLILR